MSTVIDGSAGVTTNAGGSVNPSTTIDGINYSCRAWVNFNGTGTVAIRASGNVSSITDNGTGDYTVNFTTAFVDANYTTSGSLQAIVATANPWLMINGFSGPTLQAPTTTACRVFSQQTGTGYDSGFVCLSFFR